MEKPDYWDENQIDASEPDPNPDTNVNDVLSWADGIWDSQHSELASRVTPLEAAIAKAVNDAHDKYRESAQ